MKQNKKKILNKIYLTNQSTRLMFVGWFVLRATERANICVLIFMYVRCDVVGDTGGKTQKTITTLVVDDDDNMAIVDVCMCTAEGRDTENA